MILFKVLAIVLVSGWTVVISERIAPVFRDRSLRDVSDECQTQLDAYVTGLSDGQAWAWHLFDSSPKLPYGILTGNLIESGNYDQCLSVQHNHESGEILGKFCLMAVGALIPVDLTVDENADATGTRYHATQESGYSLRSGLPIQSEQTNRTLLLSICVPDACTPAEVLESLQLTDIGLPIAALGATPCETVNDIKQFTGADIAFVSFIAVIILLVIVSTLFDVTRRKDVPVNPILTSFSLPSNFKKIAESNDNPNKIGCLDGLRVFSMLWVILGHRYSIAEIIPYVNNDYTEKWRGQTYTQYAQGAHAAVDSFMFLTGLLMAISMIRSQSKPGSKFNIIIYYLHRYLRLTPAMAVVYFLHVSVFHHLGSGPFWTYLTDRTRNNCLDRWASFFFYFQNYLDHNNMCLLHTWYLSMDMQIFLLSPAVLLPLVKFRKFMMRIGLPIMILLSMVCAFVIAYVYETQMFTEDYYIYYYYPTHTRLSAWLVGVCTGSWIHSYRNAKLDISPLLNLFIWAVVVIGMVACVFTGNTVAYNYDRLGTAFYLAIHRPAWCVGLAWVIFACMKGRGGLFNFVLSANIFETLSKVTYSMYLVHASCLLLNVAKIRYPSHFSDFEQIHLFLGDMLTTMTVGVLWFILFESPIIAVEKVIFGGGGRKKGAPSVEKKTDELNDVPDYKIEKL